MVKFPDLERFSDPESVRKLRSNAERLGHLEYARDCTIRVIELGGSGETPLERAVTRCIDAMTELAKIEKPNYYPSRTMQALKRHGAAGLVERMVMKPQASGGFLTLAEWGLWQHTFEHVAAYEFPQEFSTEVVKRAKEYLKDKRGMENRAGKPRDFT